MAKVRYQGAAQRKGFRPVNVQNNAPQRILQEANRVANGMRTQANAILSDRQTQSQAMRENFRIEQDAKDQNYRITMNNLGQEQAEAVGRINEQMRANESLYKGLASLSDTAAKAAIEFKQEYDKAELNTLLTDPEKSAELMKRYNAGLLENQAALAEANASILSAEAQGAREVEGTRAMNAFAGFSTAEKSYVAQQQMRKFPAEFQAELNGDRVFNDPRTGLTFTGEEALTKGDLYAIAQQQFLPEFMEKSGLNGLSAEFLAPGMEGIRKYLAKQQSEVEALEVDMGNADTKLRVGNELAYLESPVEIKSVIAAEKFSIIKAFKGDTKKAVEFFLEKAYARDKNGDFIMNEEARQALFDSQFGPNGEKLGDYKFLNSKFRREARIDRVNAAKEDRNIRQLEGEQFFEEQLEGLQGIFEKGNPADDQQAFNTFEAEYAEQFGYDVKLPDAYKALKKEVSNENKIEEAELLESAQLGADLTLAQAQSIVDPTIREEAVKLVQSRENEEYGGNYADLNKSLKGFAKQLTGQDLASEGMSPMGQLLVPELEADFKKYFDAEIATRSAGGKLELTAADYKLAQQTALEKLQQDVVEGRLGQEGAKYARKKDTDNNLYEFPNLNLEERASAARARDTTAIQSYGKRGDKVFDSRGVILSDKQLQKTLNTWNRTGVLEVPPVVMKLSEISGELPIDIINRQIAASGNENFEKITPPSYYQNLKGQNPEVVRLFHSATTPRQRARALAQLPDQLEKRTQTTDFQYLTDSVAGVESTSYGDYDAYNLGGSDGGHTAHGSGNSAKNKRFGKPISQLTLGELRRLHNSQQLFATGRYQFIPSTFAEVARALNLPDNTVFDASVQDAFFITRLKQRARMSEAAGIPLEEGLRMEWIGLQNLSPQEYRRVVNVARSVLSNN